MRSLYGNQTANLNSLQRVLENLWVNKKDDLSEGLPALGISISICHFRNTGDISFVMDFLQNFIKRIRLFLYRNVDGFIIFSSRPQGFVSPYLVHFV